MNLNTVYWLILNYINHCLSELEKVLPYVTNHSVCIHVSSKLEMTEMA